MKIKHKITFTKPVELWWNDPTDLDGYTQDNEKMYWPKTAWKKEADSLIVEIAEDDNGDLIVRDFEKWALFPELDEYCTKEELR